MLRFSTTIMFAACLAAAQTELPASERIDAAKEISKEAALIGAVARQVATQDDPARLRSGIEEQQLRAAHIQTHLYAIERAECAAGRYEDDRLDLLKEQADRLSDLAAIQSVSLNLESWKVLRRQAREAGQWAHRIEKNIEKQSD